MYNPKDPPQWQRLVEATHQHLRQTLRMWRCWISTREFGIYSLKTLYTPERAPKATMKQKAPLWSKIRAISRGALQNLKIGSQRSSIILPSMKRRPPQTARKSLHSFLDSLDKQVSGLLDTGLHASLPTPGHGGIVNHQSMESSEYSWMNRPPTNGSKVINRSDSIPQQKMKQKPTPPSVTWSTSTTRNSRDALGMNMPSRSYRTTSGRTSWEPFTGVGPSQLPIQTGLQKSVSPEHLLNSGSESRPENQLLPPGSKLGAMVRRTKQQRRLVQVIPMGGEANLWTSTERNSLKETNRATPVALIATNSDTLQRTAV